MWTRTWIPFLLLLSACGDKPAEPQSKSPIERKPSTAAPADDQDMIDLASATPSQIQLERLAGAFGAADQAVAPRVMSVISITLLKHFEGWSATTYDDSAGYCTIGYGHLLAKQRCSALDLHSFGFGTAIDMARGEQILESDTRLARSKAADLVKVPLSDAEFGALSAFIFNVGSKNFEQSTMRRLINQGQKELAIGQFGRWVKANAKVQPGLVIRRKCEAVLFANKLSLADPFRFDRSRCGGLGAAGESGEPIDIEEGER